MNHKPVRQHIPKLQWVNRKCLKGMKFLIELRLTDQCARGLFVYYWCCSFDIWFPFSCSKGGYWNEGGPYCHSKGILSKEKQMIMSYNCISSPSVCCLASILVGNREGVAIHMNSNLMTLSVCNLSMPPKCNCNADDQGLGIDSGVCNFVGFLNRIIHFVGSQSDKRGEGWTGYYHTQKQEIFIR